MTLAEALNILLTGIGIHADALVQVIPAEPDLSRLDALQTDLKLLEIAQEANWRATLAEALSSYPPSTTFVINGFVPPRRVRGRGPRDPTDLVEAVIATAPAGSRALFFGPQHFAISERATETRRHIAENHSVEWIIHLRRSFAVESGLHPAFRAALIAIRLGRHERGPTHTRIVTLDDPPPGQWPRILNSVSHRNDGEMENTNVLRDVPLGGIAWTYERFSGAHQKLKADIGTLGDVVALSDFTSLIDIGMHAVDVSSQLLQPREEDSEKDTVRYFTGRDVSLGGRLSPQPRHLPAAAADERKRLIAGDVLIRQLISPSARQPILAAVVTEEDLPGIIGDHLVRIRWKPEVPEHVRPLLIGYLNSPQALAFLRAKGVEIHVGIEALRTLPTPRPSSRVVAALESILKSEHQYLGWAHEAKLARDRLFAGSEFTQSVPALLERQRVDQQRIQAAREATTFDFQVRNHFPHPFAIRREQLQQLPAGKDQAEQALEAAEFQVHYLAILALLQLSRGTPLLATVPSEELKNRWRRGRPALDWGTAYRLIKEACLFSEREADPLALAIPEFATLGAQLEAEGTWRADLKVLHDSRNKRAHLERAPAARQRALAQGLATALDRVMRGMSFIANYPLVCVADYELDALFETRMAVFEVLTGTSAAHRRRSEIVHEEVPRGATGIIDNQGRFRSLSPWIRRASCPDCKRPELFIFSRLENDRVDYLAMETGHPLSEEGVAQVFKRLMQGG